MEFSSDLEELQHVAEHRRARKILRAAGIGGLIFGGIALLIGIPLVAIEPVNVILVFIGLLLVIEGLWNILAPSAAGVIVDGFALGLVGLWNLFIAVLSFVGNEPGGLRWGILGGVQIAWGIYRFTTYPRFERALGHTPEPEDLARMEKLVQTIQKVKLKDVEDHIGFQTTKWPPRVWKAQLGKEAAILVDATGHEVMILHPDELEIEDAGKLFLRQTRKARVRLKGKAMEGMIEPDSLARFRRWKGLDADEALPAE